MMKHLLLVLLVAVSYTHLDVYKRQGISNDKEGEIPSRRKTKVS